MVLVRLLTLITPPLIADRPRPPDLKRQPLTIRFLPSGLRPAWRLPKQARWTWDGWRTRCLPAILAIVCGCGIAAAHEDLLLQLRALDEKIAREGETPELLERRAALHLAHQDWDLALTDFQQALAADEDLTRAHLGMARSHLGKGNPARGLEEVEKFLQSSPKDVGGLLTRARAKAALGGRTTEASNDYGAAVANLPDRSRGVAIYFEWADHLRRAGQDHYAEAVRVLDAGLADVQGNVVLQKMAIDLEIEAGNHRAALSRIDALLAGPLAGSPHWLLRRGEVLEATGQPNAAQKSYREALQGIQKLPARRRNVTAIQELEQQAATRLAALHGPPDRKPKPSQP